MEINWQKALLLSTGLASVALVGSPSYATSPSHAQIYGVIKEDGTLFSPDGSNYSTGISSVTRRGTGFYCILPNTSTLQSEVANGTLEVQLSLWSSTWPYQTAYLAQVNNYYGNGHNECPSNDWIAVSIEQYSTTAPSPTTFSGSTAIPVTPHYVDADFTVLFE